MASMKVPKGTKGGDGPETVSYISFQRLMEASSEKPSVDLLTNMAANSWKQKVYWVPEDAPTFPNPQKNKQDPNGFQRIYNETYQVEKSVLAIDDTGSKYDVQILRTYNPGDGKVYPPKYRFTGGRYPTSASGKSKSGNNPSRPSLFPATESGATGTEPSKYFVMIESKQTGAKKLTILDIDPVSYQEMITAITSTFGKGDKGKWRGSSVKDTTFDSTPGKHYISDPSGFPDLSTVLTAVLPTVVAETENLRNFGKPEAKETATSNYDDY